MAYFLKVREELTDRLGGVTAFVRSPAVGLWKDVNKVSRDDMVMFEVMSNQLDKQWWSNYRTQLQKEFRPRGTVDLGIRRHKALTDTRMLKNGAYWYGSLTE